MLNIIIYLIGDIMNCIENKIHNISYYQYDHVEKVFIDKFNHLISTRPFKWCSFKYKILNNKKYCYFKDTTLVINLYLLNIDEAKNALFILKELLLTKGIEKIIYKKEFIIVHFHSYKIVELLKEPNLWIAVCLYKTIKYHFPYLNVNLGSLININNDLKKIDLLIEYNDEFFIINTNDEINECLGNGFYQCVFYFYKTVSHLKIKNKLISFSFNETNRINDIEKIVKKKLFS